LYVFLQRGFSLSLLILINQEDSINYADITEQYGQGKGIEWLINKRLSTLESNNMINVVSGKIIVKKHFLAIFKILNFYSKLLNINFKG